LPGSRSWRLIIPWFGGAAPVWPGGSGASGDHDEAGRTTRQDDTRIDDAAAKLAEAAEALMRYAVAIQLRYLQTMREIASERNTTSSFPSR
jgi:hypothetical protein